MADEDDKYYRVVETIESDGVEFRLCQYLEKRTAVTMHPTGAVDAAGNMITVPMVEASVVRQIQAVLTGGTAIFEPGAMLYYKGKIAAEVIRHEEKGMLARMVSSAGTGESAYATSFTGTGEFWAEPTRRHFLMGTMDSTNDEGDSLIIDDKAFYACSGKVKLGTHFNKSIMGAISSGNGIMQPMLSGKGAFVVESPVPENELHVVELRNEKLVVDGDCMLMHTKSLKPRIGALVSGVRKAYRSGEGLVYHFEGTGTVWLTPTAKIV